MHGQDFFFQAFVYLTAAVIVVPIARRLGFGSVLGYLVAGVLIGPFGLGLIGSEGQDLLHFAEFGVVMMLFLVGLELEPALLWRLRNSLIGLGGAQVGLTALAVAVVARLLGLAWPAALGVGLILALSSTAIVLQTLEEKGLLKTDAGQRSFAVLLFQDLAVIPILALLPLLGGVDPTAAVGAGAHAAEAAHAATGAAHSAAGAAHEAAAHVPWVETLPGWARTLVVLGAVGGIILAGRFLIRPVFRAIAATRLRETFTAAALLLVIAIALLMGQVGLSPALGTFLAGVVLANSEYRHELQGDIEPFKGLLLGLFFLAVGASIDFGLVAAQGTLVLALVLGLALLKFLVLFVASRVLRMGLDQGLFFALALAQGGEFCFVLLSFASRNHVLDAPTSALLVAVVALSMALTPLLLLLFERVLAPRIGTREKPARAHDSDLEENPVIIVGFGNFGSTLGRLLSANGVRATVLDYDSDRVDLLRRLGLKVYYGDATRLDLLQAAGAAHAKLIVLAMADVEKTLDIARTVRRHFPGIEILARAGGRFEAYELLQAGVDRVYRDTLDTSLRAGVDALRHLGVPAYHAQRAAQSFRRKDERNLAGLAGLWHDRSAYISGARQALREMEETIRAEQAAGPDPELDAAWDAESLRAEFGGRPPGEGAS
jgi:monovalent cation:proton antiporter-2 (CPA2) family protein